MNIEEPTFFGILPANVRYDKNLKPMEKILYTEISALIRENDYCCVSNSYFANLYGKTPETVSRWISNLAKNGYIKIEIDTLKGNQRKIYLSVKRPNFENKRSLR
jgi:DNA-binding transcriptional ArsR family regulator